MYAFVYWLTEGRGNIIPIHDLKLNQELEEKAQLRGYERLVGEILQARFGDSYFEAKVLMVGSK